ncbi:MAG: hypothetical protein EOO47_16210 [Flavobacterium sp.]|nr:MAG: hypothetical protein EOO47_16210 [Flavobacterium sp.]
MKTSQKNSNVCKPDIVMPGGDRLDQQSGMRVLGFGDFADYYSFNSGTSLAAPLAANLAAKLVAKYEHVNMQSIKALILNSAEPTGDERIMDDLNLKLKHEQSLERYEMNYEDLNKEQKKQLNKLFSSESLYRNLIGFGRPNENQALFSNEKSVTLLLEDTIELRSHKTISLNLPTYLLNYSKKDAILKLEATLCYKFLPSWGNQLAYNPLHISFNFGNSYLQSEEKETAALYAKDEHEYFNRFYQSDFSAEEKTKARKQAKGIKKDLQAWSDEFYPPSNKPFSNAQKLHLNINKAELEKVQGQISLIVRCIGKENLDAETTNYLVDHAHPFSIAIKISEKITDELANFNLYDALIEINDLEGLAEGTATLDV